MTNLARELNPSQTFQEIGAVTRVADGTFSVITESGEYVCRRAVSCLVTPRVDDMVLVAATESGRAWLLAVLEREDLQKTEISVNGDLDLRLKDGSFTVAAREGVSLVSGKEVNVASGRFNLNAVDGNIALQRLTYVGRFLRSEIEKVKTLAGTLDSVMDRFSLRVKRSYRTVEELDQLKAQQLDYKVEKTLSMRGNNALVTAEKLMKLDGEQIHLG